jgi:hypothetical protein
MVLFTWLQISYKVPSEPGTRRVALWRRLKGMGAVYLRDGVCLLPRNDDHLRRLRMIEHEIIEMGGEAVLLETTALDSVQEDRVVQRFNADRNAEFEEFLGKCRDFEAEIAKETANQHFTYAELEENDQDVTKLKRWLAKIVALDFYGAPLGGQARSHFEHCTVLLDEFSAQVFAAREERPQTEGEEDGS